jgi:hypothetical protein
MKPTLFRGHVLKLNIFPEKILGNTLDFDSFFEFINSPRSIH